MRENEGQPTTNMPNMVRRHHQGGGARKNKYVCVKDGGEIFSIPESSPVCSSFSMQQQNKNHTQTQTQDKYNNFSNKQTKSSMDRTTGSTPRRLLGGRKMRNDALRSLAGILAEARVHDSTLKEAIDAIMSTVSPSYSPPNENEAVSRTRTRTRKKHGKSRDCLRTRSVDDAIPSSPVRVSSMSSSTDDASETETETMTEIEKHERQQAAIADLAATRKKAQLRNKIAGEACLRLFNQAKGRIGWNMNMNVNVNVNPSILVSYPTMHARETKSVGTAKTMLTQDLSCSSPIRPWHEFESRNADDECGREGNFKERRTMEGCNRTYNRDTGRRKSEEKEQEREQEEGEGEEHQEVPYNIVSSQDVEEIEIGPRHLHRGIKAHVYLYNTSKPKQREGKKRREDIAIAISKAKELPNFDEWPKLPMNEADSLYRRSMKYFIGRELSRAKLAKDLDLEYVSRFKFLM